MPVAGLRGNRSCRLLTKRRAPCANSVLEHVKCIDVVCGSTHAFRGAERFCFARRICMRQQPTRAYRGGKVPMRTGRAAQLVQTTTFSNACKLLAPCALCPVLTGFCSHADAFVAEQCWEEVLP